MSMEQAREIARRVEAAGEALAASNEELKPCPFCGGDKASPVRRPDTWANVFCDGCGVIGPGTATIAEAIAAWNRRSLPEARPREVAQLLDDLIALDDLEAHIEEAYERLLPRIKAVRAALSVPGGREAQWCYDLHAGKSKPQVWLYALEGCTKPYLGRWLEHARQWRLIHNGTIFYPDCWMLCELPPPPSARALSPSPGGGGG